MEEVGVGRETIRKQAFLERLFPVNRKGVVVEIVIVLCIVLVAVVAARKIAPLFER